MTTAAVDFSDIYFTDAWKYRDDPLPRDLNATDTAIVRWFRRVVEHRAEGTLDVACIAWFAARFLCMGGILVWLAQEEDLLDAGLRDLLRECADFVPEPWSGFLRWSSEPTNTDVFRSWPPYDSSQDDDSPPPQPNRRARRARRV